MSSPLAVFLIQKYKERLLQDHRYTVRQFARDLGVKRENMNGYINPNVTRQPRIDQCVNMAKGLGMPLIEFLVRSGLASVSDTDHTKTPGIPDNLPEAIRLAMSTPQWSSLCVCPDEIEVLRSLPDLTNTQSVLEAINGLSWRVIKRLFFEHHVPKPIQDNCVHYCKFMVSDWERTSSSPTTA